MKHNQMASGDRIYMEADGKVEFMSIDSAPGGAGPYTYTVTRNLDGSGLNLWYAGDAVFNTGAAGDGFIDLYSYSGVTSGTTGPAIVGNVRNSATFNDWSEHWAIGNLDGLYGYGATTYGVGFGEYAVDTTFITIDSTDGYRVHADNRVVAQWKVDGDIVFFDDGEDERILIGNYSVGVIAGYGIRLDDNSAGDYTTFRINRIAQAQGGGTPLSIRCDDTIPDPDDFAVAAFIIDYADVVTANDIYGGFLDVGATGETSNASDRVGLEMTVVGNTTSGVRGVAGQWWTVENAGVGDVYGLYLTAAADAGASGNLFGIYVGTSNLEYGIYVAPTNTDYGVYVLGAPSAFGDLYPTNNASFDLGETSTPRKWRNAYFTGIIQVEESTNNSAISPFDYVGGLQVNNISETVDTYSQIWMKAWGNDGAVIRSFANANNDIDLRIGFTTSEAYQGDKFILEDSGDLTVTGDVTAGDDVIVGVDVVMGTGGFIRTGTVDGADNAVLYFSSADIAASARGSYVAVYGNEHGTYPGELWILSGNVAGGGIRGHAGGDWMTFVEGDTLRMGIGSGAGEDWTPADTLHVRREYASAENAEGILRLELFDTDGFADGSGPKMWFSGGDAAAEDNGLGTIAFVRDGADNEGKFILTGGTDGDEIWITVDAAGLVNIIEDIVVDEDIGFKSGTAFLGEFQHAITAARVWTFPDKSGTVAMTSDISAGADVWIPLGPFAPQGTVPTTTSGDASSMSYITNNLETLEVASGSIGTLYKARCRYVYDDSHATLKIRFAAWKEGVTAKTTYTVYFYVDGVSKANTAISVTSEANDEIEWTIAGLTAGTGYELQMVITGTTAADWAGGADPNEVNFRHNPKKSMFFANAA